MQGRIEDLEPVPEERTIALARPELETQSCRDQYRRFYRWVALTDVVSIAAALLVSYWVRFTAGAPDQDFWLLIAGTPVAVVGVYAAFHLYEAFRYTPAEEFRRIVLAVTLGIIGLVTLSFWAQAEFSRLWLGLSWTLALVFALASRRMWHAWIGRARAGGRLVFPTLVVGTNEEANHLVELMERPSFGFRVIAMVGTNRTAGGEEVAPVIGSVGDLRDLIRETGAECVFVAATAVSPKR